MSISRREFIGTAAIGGAAISALGATGKLPTRVLGRTGRNVSILAFGSGSRFLMYKDEEQGIAALHRALDLGITYVDTAYSYGDGVSETRVGKALVGRRNNLFLATKVQERNADKAMRIIEGSLKRLQTDHVDLLHIHSLGGPEDLAKIEAPNGVLKVVMKMRDEKVARAIGITCHDNPLVLKTALERHDFDCTQMALNAALVGNGDWKDPSRAISFENTALPVAKRKNLGVIAMKVFAQERLNGKAPADTLLRYSLSLPVTAAVVGMPKIEHIEQNIEVARTFKPLTPAEMRDISSRISVEQKAALDRFFHDHIDV